MVGSSGTWFPMRKRCPLHLIRADYIRSRSWAGRSGLIFRSEKILAQVTASPGGSVLKKRCQQGLDFPPPRGHDSQRQDGEGVLEVGRSF